MRRVTKERKLYIDKIIKRIKYDLELFHGICSYSDDYDDVPIITLEDTINFRQCDIKDAKMIIENSDIKIQFSFVSSLFSSINYGKFPSFKELQEQIFIKDDMITAYEYVEILNALLHKQIFNKPLFWEKNK